MGYRYWRLRVTAVDGSTIAGLTELEFRAALGGADQTGNVGGSAFASSTFAHPAFTPAKAFDGGAGEWASASLPATIGWDAGSGNELPPIEQVSMTIRTTDPVNDPLQAPKDFALEYSTDGVGYLTYWSVTGSTGWTNGETRLFNNPYPPSGNLDVNALAMHSVSGGSASKAAVDDLVMHTAVGAALTEEWVSSVAMHTVRGGRAGMAAVDDIAMHTIFGPEPWPPINPTTGGIAAQRINVSVRFRRDRTA